MKTYTIDELAKLLNWHPASIKAFLRNMKVNLEEPISEQNAEALARRLRKEWPPSKD